MKFKVGWAKARPSIISGRRNVSRAVPAPWRLTFDCVANSPPFIAIRPAARRVLAAPSPA